MPNDVIVVPIKRFDVAKERLRLGHVPDVTTLARDLATGVLKASSPRHTIVVSESEEVSRFAKESGVEVLQSSAAGLNEAVQWAYEVLSSRFDVVIVAHGDLRTPEGLGTFEPETGITLFADHHDEGTNVLVVPTGLDYHFAYGPGSLARHAAEAERVGVEYRVVRDSPWRYDVDEVSDLGEGGL
jgi:2-phospho-L-lactate guanylyltransferase